MTALIISLSLGIPIFIGLILSFIWREVVPTNKVHIVQSRKKTTSYGSGIDNGNVYYCIPSFIPIFGVTRIILPVNNFDLPLTAYEAYDKDRVPFRVDVTAFFRIEDTNIAAKRINSFEELKKQLDIIVRGSVRKILASHEIHDIMTQRSTFGEQFTTEVSAELKEWGICPVKNMELMDISDSKDSHVIADIMAKKSSNIEAESRKVVATNKQQAETAEIEAKRTVQLSSIDAKKATDLFQIEAEEAIGMRNAAQNKVVGIERQKVEQQIKEQEALTKQKEMEILSVSVQRDAEIKKAAAIVKAEQDAEILVKIEKGKFEQAKVSAENIKITASAELEKTTLEAQGVQKTGEARAEAEKAFQLAPVQAQITLAKEIGENQRYQQYLITIRQIEAHQVIGVAQAEALTKADIKVIANTGSAPQGIDSVSEILSSKGGQQVGAFLEGLSNSDVGKKVLDKIVPDVS